MEKHPAVMSRSTTTGVGEETVILPIRRQRPLAARVTECAESVHRSMGPGLEMLFYARALALELQSGGIAFQRECWIDIRYRGSSLGRRRLAFLLDGLALEVVTAERIDARERLRMRAIARAAGVPSGLVVNFGAERLETTLVDAS